MRIATMRAVLCDAFTTPEDLRIGEIEAPKPAGDEILIDVHAASVSFMDHPDAARNVGRVDKK
jgi:NADPH2:quinone reductase